MDNFTVCIISLVFLFISVGFFVTIDNSKKSRALYCGMIFLYVVMFLIYYVSDYFTGEGINQATIYHVSYGLSGAGFAEYKNVIFISFLIFVSYILLCILVFVKRKTNQKQLHTNFNLFSAYMFFFVATIMNPASLNAYKIYEDTQSLSHPDLDFSNYYYSAIQRDASHQKRNVVFIYLEGLERTYFDDQLFPELVVGLKKLEAAGSSFTNINQTTNAGWTIAGMVASQCGLPLFAPSSGNSMSGMDVFLPEAVCLGDLLAAEGYHLAYYGGANLNFAGKDKFYKSHRFDEIKGLSELQSQLADAGYVSGWGLFDDSLLDLAFERYQDLSRRGEPFGLFLLTLDTHHPDGHPSASCADHVYQSGANKMLNAVACTDHLVSRFVERIRASRYRDNTVIVIASDHLALRNSASSRLEEGDRKNLFLVLDPAQKSGGLIDKQGTTLDIGATLLPFLGYRGTIGLGRDLLSETLSLDKELGGLNAPLRAWQPEIEELWAFPKICRDLVVNVAAGTVSIDGRTFGYPTLIRLNPQLETEMRFAFNLSPGQKNLRDELNGFNSKTPFVWVDDCETINTLSGLRADSGVCLAIGRLDANPDRRRFNGKMIAVEQTLTISAEEIRGVLFN